MHIHTCYVDTPLHIHMLPQEAVRQRVAVVVRATSVLDHFAVEGAAKWPRLPVVPVERALDVNYRVRVVMLARWFPVTPGDHQRQRDQQSAPACGTRIGSRQYASRAASSSSIAGVIDLLKRTHTTVCVYVHATDMCIHASRSSTSCCHYRPHAAAHPTRVP